MRIHCAAAIAFDPEHLTRVESGHAVDECSMVQALMIGDWNRREKDAGIVTRDQAPAWPAV